MNNRPPAFFQAPPPQVDVPAPLHLPAPSSAELLGRLGTVAALTMGGTMGLILLGVTASWGVGGLTLLLLVGDGLLWAGAWLASYPLRAAVQDYHLRRSALELELDERAAYLELGRALLRAWGRKSYGRQTRPAERVVWVRDGNSPVAPSNGRSRTDTAPDPQSWQEGALNAVQRARARVATDGQTADDETRPLGALAGPAVWTPAMAKVYRLWSDGVKPSLAACKALGLSRGEWDAAMAALVELGYVQAPERGRGYEWRV
jgi:hypothetical protein